MTKSISSVNTKNIAFSLRTWQLRFIKRSLVESVYSSFKQRTKVFFNNITSNPIGERFRRSIAC
ncbi:MAG: hypothetical protein ACP5IZ_09470 [Thermoprotei archaeon]